MAKLKSGNRSAQDWYNRGHHLTIAGEYAEAIRAYSRAIELDAEFAHAYFARGACRYVLGRYRQATEDIDAATMLGCADAQMWSRFEGKCAEKDGDPEQEDSRAGLNNPGPGDA